MTAPLSNVDVDPHEAMNRAMTQLAQKLVDVVFDGDLVLPQPCRSAQITHILVGTVRSTTLRMMDAAGNQLPLPRVPNFDGPFERAKRAFLQPGKGTWASMTMWVAVEGNGEISNSSEFNYDDRVFTYNEPNRPDANDWALEFALYPRDVLPDWAGPLLSTVAPVTGVVPRQPIFPSNLAGLGFIAGKSGLWSLIQNYYFTDMLDKVLGDSRFSGSLSGGEFNFTSKATGQRITKRGSLIASVSSGAKSLLWGWAIPNHDATGAVARLKAYGDDMGMADLSNSELDLDYEAADLRSTTIESEDAYYDEVANLAGIAGVHVLGGTFYVLNTGGGTRAVLHIADVDVIRPSVDRFGFNMCMRLPRLPGVNIRTAVTNCATQAGYPLRTERMEQQWRLVVGIEEQGQLKDIEVNFSLDDRLLSVGMPR